MKGMNTLSPWPSVIYSAVRCFQGCGRGKVTRSDLWYEFDVSGFVAMAKEEGLYTLRMGVNDSTGLMKPDCQVSHNAFDP